MPDGEQNEAQGTDAQGTQDPGQSWVLPSGEADKPNVEQTNDQGFPADTPWREMTLGQQVEYWKANARKHEQNNKAMSDYDELKSKASEYAKLVEASKTEQEKALDAAVKEAKESTLREVGSRLVDAQFTVASAGRFDADQEKNQERLSALLDNLDRLRFMKEDGTADAAKVKSFIDSVAPAQKQETPRVDFGQGSRQGTSAPSVEAGADLYRQLHPQPTSS